MNTTTRAEPLSFRAIKDLAISHCTVGRKSRGRLLAVGYFASWHPKKTIIRVQSWIIVFFGVAKSLIAQKDTSSARVVVLITNEFEILIFKGLALNVKFIALARKMTGFYTSQSREFRV